jgi:multidrug efflux system outer membrane protein
LDLFGRVRSLKTAALEQYLATQQARSAAQISLVGAVASSYLALAGDRENLRLAQETLNTQQASYNLILHTRDAGMASDLDLRQAQSQVEAARVDIARYSGLVSLDENTLNLLVGTPVPANLLPNELSSDSTLKDIAAGVPSEVLLRRPDILMAEHQLQAAYANIGAARAAFFPRISLTGGVGFVSSELQNLFTYNTRTWTFAPRATLPIFDAGARKANYKVAQVDRDLAVAEYEKAIQSAFREVSDSLSLRTRLLEQQEAQQALVTTLEETYRLSEARYKAGIDGYLSVLVAQRSLYGAQQGLVNLRRAHLGNLVTLYKVLGGGAQ